MSQQNPIRVYVTHSFAESDDYLRVFEYLESARGGFFYRNLALPSADAGATLETRREAYRSQMAQAEAIIGLASLYGSAQDALLFQLTFAQATRKPTLLLPPFGSQFVVPPPLLAMTTAVLEWDERALVDGLRQHARGESTGRWDVVEFKLD
jgi:hypothetical protein